MSEFEEYVKARTKRCVGRTLTAIESAGLKDHQFEAVKSLVQQAIYDLRNDILEYADAEDSV